MRTPLVAGITALALAGCSTAPDYIRPEAPVPPAFPTGAAYLAQTEPALPDVSWREVFLDPRLQALIGQALANNRDVRVAAANVAAARARVRVVRSNQFPEVSAGAAADFEARDNAPDSERYALDVGVAGFELDLFGRLAGATEAERERALASEAAARTVRIALVADLANTWATYAADQALLAIARDTAANARRAVELTQLRREGGIAPRTDVRQAEQVLLTAEGDLAELTALVAQDENLIRLLVGGPVDPGLLPGGLDEVADAVTVLPAGTDSAVLLRRPDIAEAEFLLRAANADIGVARAELFPRITLGGLVGLASGALGALFDAGSLAASIGADAGYTIFDAGGRRANVAVTEAQRDAALAAYERSIQRAFREVADVLADRGTIDERLRTARANSAAAADTANLTEARYRGGIDSFLANLDAQRSLYAARQREAAVLLAAVQNRIALYRALGADSALADPSVPPASVVGQDVEGPVALGQTAYVGGPRVRPDEVLEDSRCPAGTQCVWAGRVVVRATVFGGNWSKVVDLTLGTPVQVADGALSLVAVTPERPAGDAMPPERLRFSFAFAGGI
jgi:multidrug efflux system outer membrane protein